MSSTEVAIKVSNLSKRYMIGKQKDSSLRGTLSNLFKAGNSSSDEFWALKDLNFEISKGDVIGIIGKNGAGKSTLLKILSQITAPTTGRIEINGRVASLLEVGTGFHPELTGRENIYLNGTILGMTRKEVKEKFDEIVEFSGIEKFIDTPVKRYSSGMYVRLAFAVAAHLEPEILVIDEVLAVGDADFQKKCLGKMQDVANQGRTVIFVSHDMEAVQTLCTKGILLDQGMIKEVGSMKDVLTTYTNNYQESCKSWSGKDRPGDDVVRLNNVSVVDVNQKPVQQLKIDDKFGVRVEFEILVDDVRPTPNFHFFSGTNSLCFVAMADEAELKRGVYQSVTWIPENLFNNQIYRIGVAITTLKNVNIHLYEREIINIELIENKLNRDMAFGGQIPGILRPKFTSEIKRIE